MPNNPEPSFDLELGFVLLATLLVTAPALVGGGIDLPDDALYFQLSSWEWLQTAWSQGLSPWWVPGKLGGASLFADVVPMGPFYPAAWSLKLLPAATALPLMATLHGFAIVLAIRWLARSFGIGPQASTLAGAGLMLGTVGASAWIDFQGDTIAAYLWFAVLLGAQERLAQSPSNRERCWWLGLGALALSLLLLGSHVRFAAASCGAFALWSLLRGRELRWSLLMGLLGLLGGMPGYLPYLHQLTEVTPLGGRLELLSGPVHERLELWSLPGFLIPKALWYGRDFSLGAVLGLAALLGFQGQSGPIRRLGFFAIILLGAAVSPEVPGLRYLFTPLLVLTHPVDLFYAALAMIPAAVVGAAGFEALASMNRANLAERLRGPGTLLTAALIVLACVRAVPALKTFPTPFQWSCYWPSLVQFSVVVGACSFIMLTRLGKLRMRLLFAIAVVDLALLSLRMHSALPSTELELAEREHIEDLELLKDGYLDITDLAELEGFLYGEEHRDGPKAPIIERWTKRSARELVERRWPVHLGQRHNIRGLAGRAKMPPARATELLAPLAVALAKGSGPADRLEDKDPNSTRALFADGSMGKNIMVLYGIPIAVGKDGIIARVEGLAPPCYSPESTVHVSDRGALIHRLLNRDFRTRGPALIETPLDSTSIHTASSIQCPQPGTAEVKTATDSLAVFRFRHHPGWTIRDAKGRALDTFPVNLVHTGVLLPPGDHQLSFRFMPPGLRVSLLSTHFALLIILTLASWGRRRLHSTSEPPSPDSR